MKVILVGIVFLLLNQTVGEACPKWEIPQAQKEMATLSQQIAKWDMAYWQYGES